MGNLKEELDMVGSIRVAMRMQYGKERFEDPVLNTIMGALREYENAIKEKLKQSDSHEIKTT